MASNLYKKIMALKSVKDSTYTKEDYDIDMLPTNWFNAGTVTLNLLMAGRTDKGIPQGKITQIAGPSKYGKSFILACAIKDAQDCGKNVVLFDVERAYDRAFYSKLGVDVEQLIVIQENMIEKVQQKFMEISEELTKEDKRDLFIGMDSWGALADTSAVKYAMQGADTRNMGMSQKKNNFARLMLGSGITIAVINHIHDNTGGFGDPLKVSGGRGIEYLGQLVLLLMSKAKFKDGENDITGTVITAEASKTRYGKEFSKLKFRIKYDGGLDYWYGLLDDAIEIGVVVKEGNRYVRPCVEGDKKWWEKDIYCNDFWVPVFNDTDFNDKLQSKYSFRDSEIDFAKGLNSVLG